MAGRIHSEAVGNAPASALSIATGSTRNPRAHLHWLRVENLDAAGAWVNFYNAAADTVTPGTTPRYGEPIHIPASQAPTVIPIGLQFRADLSIFVSSAADGTGVPTTGCRIDGEYARES